MRFFIALSLLALAATSAHGHWGGGFFRGFRRYFGGVWTFRSLKCAVEDSAGEAVTTFPWYAALSECEEGSSCSIGPLQVNKWRQSFNVTFCNEVDEDGNLLVLRGACLIIYSDDNTEAIDNTYGLSFCTGGPLQVEYNGRPAEAFYPNFDDFGCGYARRRWRTLTTTTTTTVAPEGDGEGEEDNDLPEVDGP